jgi:hypothetical protein
MKTLRLSALLITALVAGCASGSGEGVQTTRRGSSVLTVEELRMTPYDNLYDAVVALRRNWVRERPPARFGSEEGEQVIVFLEDTRLGGVASLRQLRVEDVASVRYLSVSEAAMRFGRQANARRVLMVTVRKGP